MGFPRQYTFFLIQFHHSSHIISQALSSPGSASGPSEDFTHNGWLRTELLAGSWIGLEESVRILFSV